MQPHRISRQDIPTGYDYGQFYVYAGYADKDSRDNAGGLLDEAFAGGQNISQGRNVVLVAVPPQQLRDGHRLRTVGHLLQEAG